MPDTRWTGPLFSGRVLDDAQEAVRPPCARDLIFSCSDARRCPRSLPLPWWRCVCMAWDPPSGAVPDDVAPLDVEPTDPVVQAGAEARERRARDPKERLDLLRRQLDPHL